MNLREFVVMSQRYWEEAYDKNTFVPPEARVITGLAQNDAFFHRMLVEHGVEMHLEKEGSAMWKIVDYQIVDEQKFMMFVLRWA